MLEIENHSLMQTLSMVALAIIALSVGVQKLLKDWKSTNAETNIITLMHSELERLSTQNGVLSTELNRLQQEMIKLNIQLGQLCIDNQVLQILSGGILSLIHSCNQWQYPLCNRRTNGSTHQAANSSAV